MELKGLEDGVLRLRADASGRDVALLIMPFPTGGPIEDLAELVRDALGEFDVVCMRADDKAYSDSLWDNIRIYMHAADYGIAIYEQVDTSNYNPNVSIEVGYMMALGTPLCLLKEKRLPRLPTDIAGKLYFEFDIFAAASSIRAAIARWASSVDLSPVAERSLPPASPEFVVLPPGVGPRSLRRMLRPLMQADSLGEEDLRSESRLGAHSFSRHLGYLRASGLVVQAELAGRPARLTERGRAFYDGLTGGREGARKVPDPAFDGPAPEASKEAEAEED
jgi:hypothetical protein